MIKAKRSGETDSQEKRLLLTNRFFRAFYSMMQSVKIHQNNNQLVIKSAETFIRSVIAFTANTDDLTIQIRDGRFYLQNEKLLYRKQAAPLINSIFEYFEKRGLQGFRIFSDINDASIDEILLFARLLNNAEGEKTPADWIILQLKEEDIPWVEIIQEEKAEDSSTLIQDESESHSTEESLEVKNQRRREKSQRIYGGALTSLKEISKKIASHRRVGIRRTIRIVQNMIDCIVEDEPILIGMSTIRDYDDYTYTHSVNVSILSICMGTRIGLSKSSLEKLGICSLFHDLGKVDIPIEIINKPGKLDNAEFEEVQKHSLNSVHRIISLKASRELKAKILLPPFEHHLKYDLSGYPQTHRKNPISLFGRIITIADVYDAMTSPRIYRPFALSPDRVLGMMQESSGKDFDPILLKVFINMLGTYPVGTLLELDDGSICIVKEYSNDSDSLRPLVVTLVPDDKNGFSKGDEVNLAEREHQTGNFKRNPIKSLHPGEYGIQPAQYII